MGYSRALRHACAISLALGLLGCGGGSGADHQQEIIRRNEERSARLNPVGAFQMVTARETNGREDIYLLDTRDGTLRRCWFSVGELTVSCGDPRVPLK